MYMIGGFKLSQSDPTQPGYFVICIQVPGRRPGWELGEQGNHLHAPPGGCGSHLRKSPAPGGAPGESSAFALYGTCMERRSARFSASSSGLSNAWSLRPGSSPNHRSGASQGGSRQLPHQSPTNSPLPCLILHPEPAVGMRRESSGPIVMKSTRQFSVNPTRHMFRLPHLFYLGV